MPSRRLAQDEAEVAHHQIAKLTSEGWIVRRIEVQFSPEKMGKARLSHKATLTVEMSR